MGVDTDLLRMIAKEVSVCDRCDANEAFIKDAANELDSLRRDVFRLKGRAESVESDNRKLIENWPTSSDTSLVINDQGGLMHANCIENVMHLNKESAIRFGITHARKEVGNGG